MTQASLVLYFPLHLPGSLHGGHDPGKLWSFTSHFIYLAPSREEITQASFRLYSLLHLPGSLQGGHDPGKHSSCTPFSVYLVPSREDMTQANFSLILPTPSTWVPPCDSCPSCRKDMSHMSQATLGFTLYSIYLPSSREDMTQI